MEYPNLPQIIHFAEDYLKYGDSYFAVPYARREYIDTVDGKEPIERALNLLNERRHLHLMVFID